MTISESLIELNDYNLDNENIDLQNVDISQNRSHEFDETICEQDIKSYTKPKRIDKSNIYNSELIELTNFNNKSSFYNTLGQKSTFCHGPKESWHKSYNLKTKRQLERELATAYNRACRVYRSEMNNTIKNTKSPKNKKEKMSLYLDKLALKTSSVAKVRPFNMWNSLRPPFEVISKPTQITVEHSTKIILELLEDQENINIAQLTQALMYRRSDGFKKPLFFLVNWYCQLDYECERAWGWPECKSNTYDRRVEGYSVIRIIAEYPQYITTSCPYIWGPQFSHANYHIGLRANSVENVSQLNTSPTKETSKGTQNINTECQLDNTLIKTQFISSPSRKNNVCKTCFSDTRNFTNISPEEKNKVNPEYNKDRLLIKNLYSNCRLNISRKKLYKQDLPEEVKKRFKKEDVSVIIKGAHLDKENRKSLSVSRDIVLKRSTESQKFKYVQDKDIY